MEKGVIKGKMKGAWGKWDGRGRGDGRSKDGKGKEKRTDERWMGERKAQRKVECQGNGN